MASQLQNLVNSGPSTGVVFGCQLAETMESEVGESTSNSEPQIQPLGGKDQLSLDRIRENTVRGL